jgi:hypothetical protein
VKDLDEGVNCLKLKSRDEKSSALLYLPSS